MPCFSFATTSSEVRLYLSRVAAFCFCSMISSVFRHFVLVHGTSTQLSVSMQVIKVSQTKIGYSKAFDEFV